MKTLYLDCFSGASGDMLLGALIDLGFKTSALEWELSKLDLPDKYHLHANREERHGITGIRFIAHEGAVHRHDQDTHGHEHSHAYSHEHEHHGHSHGHSHGEHEHHECCGHHHEHEHKHEHGHAHPHESRDCCHGHEHEHVHGRSFAEIEKMIANSALSDRVKQRASSVFRRIAEAEGKIHGVEPAKVEFHEVGALDSIIDIIGFCAGVEKLGIQKIVASRLSEGRGWVQCAHGRFPVPAPATLEILKGIELEQADESHELITPTGAALLAEYAESFGAQPVIKIEKIGYGVGTRNLKSRPNVLRAVLGESSDSAEADRDTVAVLESNLDDVSGEIIGHVYDKLFAAGALDVFVQSIQMKKNRPAFLLSVIGTPAQAEKLAEIILTETSAFGIRQTTAQRWKLERKIESFDTSYGSIEVKKGFWKGNLVQAAPEFASCQEAAAKHGVPLSVVYQAAQAAAGASLKS